LCPPLRRHVHVPASGCARLVRTRQPAVQLRHCGAGRALSTGHEHEYKKHCGAGQVNPCCAAKHLHVFAVFLPCDSCAGQRCNLDLHTKALAQLQALLLYSPNLPCCTYCKHACSPPCQRASAQQFQCLMPSRHQLRRPPSLHVGWLSGMSGHCSSPHAACSWPGLLRAEQDPPHPSQRTTATSAWVSSRHIVQPRAAIAPHCSAQLQLPRVLCLWPLAAVALLRAICAGQHALLHGAQHRSIEGSRQLIVWAVAGFQRYGLGGWKLRGGKGGGTGDRIGNVAAVTLPPPPPLLYSPAF
jgi:hypothetical protein